MKNDIRLLCTDIDGTLLNAERYLSDRTVAAFAKAKLPVILASSRMPDAMRYLQKGLDILDAPMIAYNGGLILDRNNKIIESNTVDVDVLEALAPHYKKQTYNLSVYSHDYWFTEQEDYWSLREINNTRVTPVYQSVAESIGTLKEENLGIHKLMCMGTPEEIDSIVTHLSPNFGTRVHLYRSKDTYLEITPKNIDKAKALHQLLEYSFDFGMEAVMAFGDNHNDDELIKHAGLGVAVGNATETLKSLANYVSAFTNKENAVAKAIEHFIFKTNKS